jgi:D-alanine-D-alanine ligase
MRALRVTLLYDADEDEQKAEAQARGGRLSLVYERVREALAARGHQVSLLAAPARVRSLATQVERLETDVVFNLCESLGGVSQHEQNVAALLELSGIAFTGSGSLGLSLAQDKELSKKLLHFHGIRYPKFSSIDSGQVGWADDMEFPLFVKPANQDASIGIDETSIVRNVKELMEQISRIHTEVRAPVLIEEYIEGREIYVGVFGNTSPEAFPILEWDFSTMPDGTPRIASAAAKWDESSVYRHAREFFPEDIPEAVAEKIRSAAISACKAMKLRDYARVDLRLVPPAAAGARAEAVDGDWAFYVIEVNPNPHLDPASEFALGARQHGLEYGDLLERTLEFALARGIKE